MPIYEYRCTKCGTKFELMRPFSEADKATVCLKCGSEAQKLVSGFACKTGSYMQAAPKPFRSETAGSVEKQTVGVEEKYPIPKGTIRRLITDRGFGFIRTAEGKDLFFHRSELQGVDYSSLREGQGVEFEIGHGRDGRLEAVRVRLAPQAKQVDSERP